MLQLMRFMSRSFLFCSLALLALALWPFTGKGR